MSEQEHVKTGLLVFLVVVVSGMAMDHCTVSSDHRRAIEHESEFCRTVNGLVAKNKLRMGTPHATRPLPTRELNAILGYCYQNDALWFNETLEAAMMADLKGETGDANKHLDAVLTKLKQNQPSK